MTTEPNGKKPSRVNYPNVLLASMTGTMISLIALASATHYIPVELPTLAGIWALAASFYELHIIVETWRKKQDAKIQLTETIERYKHEYEMASLRLPEPTPLATEPTKPVT